jgi:hypothetical protein
MKREDVIKELLLNRKTAIHLFYITQQFGIQINTKHFDQVTVIDDEPEVLNEVRFWAEDIGLLVKQYPSDPKLLHLEIPAK